MSRFRQRESGISSLLHFKKGRSSVARSPLLHSKLEFQLGLKGMNLEKIV